MTNTVNHNKNVYFIVECQHNTALTYPSLFFLGGALFMVATGQEKVREKINFSRSGKSQSFQFYSGKMETLKKSQEKVSLVREKWDFMTTISVEVQYPVIPVQ